MCNLDFNDPAIQERYLRITEAGAGSNRPFSHDLHDSPLGRIPGVGPKVIQPLLDASHGFLFGMPEGKALSGSGSALERIGRVGFDIRLRTLAEATREAFEGNQDPQRVREFANQFGQYATKSDQVIDKMKQIPVLSPFVSTSLPVQLTELRQLTGDIGLKNLDPKTAAALRAEVLARGTFGTVLGVVALNKLLSGHYPWENSKGHETDIQIGQDSDGSPVYLSSTAFAPETIRPLRNIGVKAALSHMHDGEDDRFGQFLTDEGHDAYNAAGEIAASPLTTFASTALTGRTPFYMTPRGDLLKESTPAPTLPGQVMNNVGAAVGNMHPLLAWMPGRAEFGAHIESPGYRAAQDVLSFGLNNPLRKDDPNQRPAAPEGMQMLKAYARWQARQNEQ